MRHLTFSLTLAASLAAAAPLAAQQAWVQLEAKPSTGEASLRAELYDRTQDNVAGFTTGGRWNVVALGPFDSAGAARAALRRLRASGLVPGDAFVSDGSRYRERFYPAGAGSASAPTPEAQPETAGTPPPAAAPSDETLREARASEGALDRPAREALQVALAWAGHYDGRIDGAFGRGTRAAMESWQVADGTEPTGVMTTAQRARLLAAYDAVLDGMDLQRVADDAAGIALRLPTGAVRFADYDPPFARFDAISDDLPAQVLLISQPGDQTRLFGLYEILQTLEIVPTDGPRERRDDGFTIEGSDAVRRTYVTADLRDGQIKGFALVWPAGDDGRFTRLRDEMRASFERTEGILDPAIAPPDEDQAIDLVAGLQVRKPRAENAGFYIDGDGRVLTAAAPLQSCERIVLGADGEARLLASDATLGLAVLEPGTPLAPLAVATFQRQVPRLQSQVAVAGYPWGGVLPAATLTFGRLADIRGLEGEEDLKRLELRAQAGDAGGPVYDESGAVLGMLLPRAADAARSLPAEVSFVIDSDRILAFLDEAGVAPRITEELAAMPPETLTRLAADSTVLVSCW